MKEKMTLETSLQPLHEKKLDDAISNQQPGLVHRTLQFLGRSLIIGFGYALTWLLAGFLLGLDMGSGFPLTLSLAVLAGTVLALVFSVVAHRSHLTRLVQIVIVGWALFLTMVGANIIEIPFFTTYPTNHVLILALQGLAASLALATLLTTLVVLYSPTVSWFWQLRLLLQERSWFVWILRFALCGLTYIVLYFVVGGVFYLAFLQPYYTDPALAQQLHLKSPPNFGVLLPLEFVRGLIFTLAMFPLIVAVRLERKWLALWLGLILFVAGDLAPMLQAQSMALPLRIYHGVEIFFQNFPLGITIGALLGWSKHTSIFRSY